jgi:formamidopyrimidine-DNA glycosylase
MIELPEAVNLAGQLAATIGGKKITRVVAGFSPHKFTWYHGDPRDYDALLRGKTVGTAISHGGIIKIQAENTIILLNDGVVLRFHEKDDSRPKKHQLLIEFDGGTAISASVQMYAGIICFKDDEYESPYYDVARVKPSPLSDEFDREYFDRLIAPPDVQKLSAKAFLATGQRIPGLGNGILQDILYNARIHPKRKVATLTDIEKDALFSSIKSTLQEITTHGGRDTEKGLFGKPGGYRTRLSKNTVGQPCPLCGGMIIKQPYLGGSIYFCDGCQRL